MLVQPPLLLLLYPCNPHIVIIVPLNYSCQVGQDYIVAPLGLHCGPVDSCIQKGGFVICIIQEFFIHVMYQRFPPSKWLISKVFISLFFYFWSQFHNIWYQSFGFQGFAAPNRSSWNFHYNCFYMKVQKLKFLE